MKIRYKLEIEIDSNDLDIPIYRMDNIGFVEDRLYDALIDRLTNLDFNIDIEPNFDYIYDSNKEEMPRYNGCSKEIDYKYEINYFCAECSEKEDMDELKKLNKELKL